MKADFKISQSNFDCYEVRTDLKINQSTFQSYKVWVELRTSVIKKEKKLPS